MAEMNLRVPSAKQVGEFMIDAFVSLIASSIVYGVLAIDDVPASDQWFAIAVSVATLLGVWKLMAGFKLIDK